jgi:gliding motility-associated-like protein
MKKLVTLVFLVSMYANVFAQPCTYRDSFKPTLTSTCATYTIGPYVGWAQFCNDTTYNKDTTGYLGSGRYTVLKVCTDSAASCINLTPSPGTYTGNMEITLFSGCWTNSPTGYVNNSYRCINNSTGIYSTEGLGLAPNTCYVAAIWTKDTGTFQICRQLNAMPTDDSCLGATVVPFAATSYNTSCYTYNSAKEPAPSTFLCGSSGTASKTRWFKFTATCDTFLNFYFTNMTCVGGAGGYQVGTYVGNCNSLTNVQCNSGTGGSFTITTSGLSIGQTVYLLVNGSSGANCNFSLRTDVPTIAKNITMNTSICFGKSIVIGGIPRSAAGTYKDTIFKMCHTASVIDSIRTFNLTLRPTSTTTIDTAICSGKFYFFKGQNRTTAGTYRDTLPKANGCDSIIILNLGIKSLSFNTINSQICSGQSVLFNGISRTATGTYLDTLTNSVGCDSFITLNLIVNPTKTTNIYDTICQGGSRFFNGLPRTTTGIFLDTLMTFKNCDSFIVLNLFVKSNSTKTIDTAICQGFSILFKGQNRTTSGTYRDTLINSKGCDSFVILNLTIKPTSAINLNTAICLGQFVFFKGQNRTTAGTYRDTLLKVNGCDSILILNLTVKPFSFKTIDSQICTGQSVLFNGISRTATGTYLDTLVNSVGCDSFITLSLTVNPTKTTNIYDTICQGGSRFFNGLPRTTTGIFLDTLMTFKNCDSFIVLNLFVKSNSTKTIDTAICQGFSILFKGQNRTTNGTYRDTLINSKGCDSFVILNLTIKPTSITNINVAICQGSFIFFKGQNRTTAGIYRDTLIKANGCDSLVILNLAVNPIKTTNLSINLCAGNSYLFKGQNRTLSGIYRDTLKTSYNCDSIIILNLSVSPILIRTIDTAICQGKTMFFKGQNRTTAGTYRDTIINTSPSCDSVITLNLTIKNSSTKNLYDTICQGQTRLFKGIPRTVSGIYIDTLVNSIGCDSFAILNLIIKAIPIVNAGQDTSRVNCITDSVRLGTASIAGHTYTWIPNTGLSNSNIAQPIAKPTSTSTYILEATLTSSGCKLRDTVTVNVLPSTVNASVRKYQRICKGASGQSIGGTPTATGGTSPFSFLWTPNLYLNNNTIANPNLINTQHGTYQYVVQVTDSKGCLARDTATVIIDSLPVNTAGKDTNLCRNSPLTIGKIAQNKITYSWNPATNLSANNISNPSFNSSAAGSFQYILTVSDSSNTCTLLDTITVQVNPQKFDTLRPAICAGQSFFFNGAPRTAAGTYFQTTTTSKGCDSFVVLYLTVNNTSTRTIDSQICQGSAVFFKSQNRTTTGTYRDTLVNSKNCDSFVILNLVVNPTPTTNLNITICQGTFVNFKSIPRTTTGIYRDTFLTSKNCDSFIILNLTVSPKSYRTIDTAICQGRTYFFKGQPRSANMTLIDTLVNAAGCDSIVTLNLVIKDTSTRIIRDTICKNSTRFFNGNFLNVTGVYRDTLTNAKGCDSFLYLHLVVKDTSFKTLFDTICSNQIRNFNGINRTTTGIYKDTLTNALGCDSFVYLNLFVKSTSSSTRNISICTNQSYFFKGQNRTTSGIYYDTILNTKGCDSFMTLNLTVHTLSYKTIDTAICRGRVYFFKGQNRASTGTYLDTLINSKGCDSFITLNLAFKDTSRYVYADTICKNQPTWFNGQFRDFTGLYRDTLINTVGCDSFLYLNLFVKNISTTNLRDTICGNKFFTFKGINLNQTGVYRDTLINTLDCDSFVILNLVVNPTTFSNRTINICQGESYSFKNQLLSNSGTYYDTLINKKGCDSFITLTLNVNPLPVANAGLDQTRVNCDGDSVRLGANPDPSYIYLWTPYSNLSSPNIANPYSKATSKTVYYLLVRNGITNCQSKDTVEVDILNSQLSGTAIVRNLRCHNDNSGQLRIQANNGYLPYNYKINGTGSYTTSNIINNLSAAPPFSTYTIRDGKGCLYTDTFTISQPDSISITTLSQNDLKCFNDNSGQIAVLVSGGIAPYNYQWDRSPSDSFLAAKLDAGIHIISILDDSLCRATKSFQLREPSPINIIDSLIKPNPCQGDSLGLITVKAGGGALQYIYKWSNGKTGESNNLLKKGSYTVTVEDVNLCSDSFTFTLFDPFQLVIDSVIKTDLNCNDNGQIIIQADGGTPPYLHSINYAKNYQTDSLFNINSIGDYGIVVRDKKGCTVDSSITIGYQNLLKIEVYPEAHTLNLGESIQLGFKVTEGDSNHIQGILWSPSEGLSCTDCVAPVASLYATQTYTLQVNFAQECLTKDHTTIMVQSNDELYIPSAFSPLSDKIENQSFKVYSNNILRANLSIYNRWGEKVYESEEPHRIGWDGNYNGQGSPGGIYYYFLDLTYLDGKKLIRKGEFNLIR